MFYKKHFYAKKDINTKKKVYTKKNVYTKKILEIANFLSKSFIYKKNKNKRIFI